MITIVGIRYNFKCSIYTRLHAFYFKLFFKAIALNNFIHKIKKKDSPSALFCNNEPETFIHIHVFIYCNVVKPIWDQTLNAINNKIEDFKCFKFS